MLGLHGKVPNTSAGSWFQIFMVVFTKEYFPISVLCFLCFILEDNTDDKHIPEIGFKDATVTVKTSSGQDKR